MFNRLLFAIFPLLLTTTQAFASFQAFDGTQNLGVMNIIQCSSTGGLTCSKTNNTKLVLQLATTAQDSAGMKIFGPAWKPGAASQGTSTTPSATTVYLTQIRIPVAVTLTGIKVLNAATVGTDKYIAALFNSSGTKLANSALAGATTSGASSYQALAFTSTKAVTPGTYWIGLYVDGTTDRFYSIPAIGEIGGLAGSVTGQTFGTVANVTLPTTFTADKGPIAFVY